MPAIKNNHNDTKIRKMKEYDPVPEETEKIARAIVKGRYKKNSFINFIFFVP